MLLMNIRQQLELGKPQSKKTLTMNFNGTGTMNMLYTIRVMYLETNGIEDNI
jgi:hypothetical protein